MRSVKERKNVKQKRIGGLQVVCVANVECRVELLGLADGVVPRVQGASIGEQQVRIPELGHWAEDCEVRVGLWRWTIRRTCESGTGNSGKRERGRQTWTV